MALGNVDLLQGESRLLTMYLSAGSGTVSATGGLFSLFDSNGTPVAGLSAQAATCDPAAATIKVQYLLSTGALAPGPYYAVLSASATTSADGLTTIRSFDYDCWVRRVPDIP